MANLPYSGLAGAASNQYSDALWQQREYERMVREQYYANQAASAAACQSVSQPSPPADNPVLLLLD